MSVNFSHQDVMEFNSPYTPRNFYSPNNKQTAARNMLRQLNKYGYAHNNYRNSNIVTRVALREEAEERAKERGVAPLPIHKGSRALVPINNIKPLSLRRNTSKMSFAPQHVRKPSGVATAARKTRRYKKM